MQSHVRATDRLVSRRSVLGRALALGALPVLGAAVAACGPAAAPTATPAPAKPAEPAKPAAAPTTAAAPKPTDAPKPAAEPTKPAGAAATKPAEAAKPPAAAPVSAKATPGKLRHLTWLGGPQKELYDQLLKDYQQARPGVEVAHETVAGTGAATYPDAIKTGMAGGSPQDVFFMWGGSIAAPFIDAGGILALDPYYEQLGWNKLFFPWVVDMIKRKGKTWGAPKNGVGMSFWYRKDIFEKVGVAEAKTYDEVEQNNRKLRQANIAAISIGGKFGWNTMRLLDYMLEVTAGPDLHRKLERLEESWDRKEVVESYRLLKKWVDEKWIVPGFLTVAPNDALLPWYKGDAAMVYGSTTQEASIKTAEQPIEKYDFYINPTGQTPARFCAYPHQLMIAQASKMLDTSLDFINWISQPDIQKKYIAALGSTATVGASPDPKEWPLTAKWMGTLEKAKDVYPPKDQAFYKELMDGFFEIQDGIVAGQISPEDGAKRMQQKAVEWQQRTGKKTTLD